MISVVGKIIFDTVGGKALAIAGGFVALVAWWQIDKAFATRAAFNQGASNAKAGFEQKSDELAGRMGAAADRAADLNAHDRLRARWCVDCGGR